MNNLNNNFDLISKFFKKNNISLTFKTITAINYLINNNIPLENLIKKLESILKKNISGKIFCPKDNFNKKEILAYKFNNYKHQTFNFKSEKYLAYRYFLIFQVIDSLDISSFSKYRLKHLEICNSIEEINQLDILKNKN